MAKHPDQTTLDQWFMFHGKKYKQTGYILDPVAILHSEDGDCLPLVIGSPLSEEAVVCEAPEEAAEIDRRWFEE